jgi:hypothetical protein
VGDSRPGGVDTVEGMARSDAPAPYLELLAGGAWWTVGSGVFDRGMGTVVLAAGLGVTGGLVAAVRRHSGSGTPLSTGERNRLLRMLFVTVLLIAGVSAGLAYFDYAELAGPVACALVGAVLVPLSSLLGARSTVLAGGALMLLGAAGALLALGSAGDLYPLGLVGLGAGVVLWVAGAHRTGLLDELRGHVRG